MSTWNKESSRYQRQERTLLALLFGGHCAIWRYSFMCLVVMALSCTTTRAQCVNRSTIDSGCPSNHFFDVGQSCCMACTRCNLNSQEERSPCNQTHDAVCAFPCPFGLRWSEPNKKCIISNCSQCQGGSCISLTQCLCDKCHEGDMCLIQKTTCQNSDISEEERPEAESSSLNPLTIGLISIGVVIGIVVFSSCFLLFGFCTTKQRHISSENQGSENSESGLISGRAFTNSTRSSYMSSMNGTTAYLNHQSMLELLRHSSTPVHSSGSDSSNLSSPRSFRSSPKLVRTSPLAMEKFEKGQITPV